MSLMIGGATTSSFSSLLLFAESDRVISAQERYNLATFMVLFFLITIEVVLVKVATYEYERDDDQLAYSRRDPAAVLFFDHGDE